MKQAQWKGFFSGVCTTLLLVSLVVTAVATTGKVQKELEYRNISVTLNGKKLDLKDAKGNAVEPFMMDGTNYLPVRALAESLGLNVAWDSTTNTVNLSTIDSGAPVDESPKTDLKSAQEEIKDFYSGKSGVLNVTTKTGAASASEKLSVVVTYGAPYTRSDFQSLLTETVDSIIATANKHNTGIFFIEVVLESNGNQNLYWHSYTLNPNAFNSGSKIGDLFDKENNASYEDVLYTDVASTMASYKAPEVVTLSAGEYVVGKDITDGTYNLSAISGTGNLIVYTSAGRLMINEVFGIGYGYTASYQNATLNKGAKIKIAGSLRVQFSPTK